MSEINATLNGAAGADVGSRYHVREHHPEHGTLLGFWIYLMSDCLIFASLFATYAVLGRNYAGGPSGAELFNLKMVGVNTGFLLVSSITFGFAMIAAQAKNLGRAQLWLAVTGILGACFLGLELYEFVELIHEGAGPSRSGFLTAFFSLVGTHGLHVLFGIVWLVTLIVQLAKHGLSVENMRRMSCLSMFWHFLDVVWIFVFTFVYLMGTLP
jgi:cytochrome o ubiquinol oxidase subunit 3